MATESILFVDLDGTLTVSDVSFEAFIAILKKNPLYLFSVIFWLFKGKAYCKKQIALRVQVDASLLPYNQEVVEYLKEQHASGRRLVLASASDEIFVEAVAKHFGFFENTLASDGKNSLSGKVKLKFMKEYSAGKPIAYAGNSSVDIPIWKECEECIVVTNSLSFARRMQKQFKNVRQIVRKELSAAIVSALRPHQWAKNLLIFIPPVMAHKLMEPELGVAAWIAFLSFCACASAVYVINDLCDIESDRLHFRKSKRAIASGRFPVKAAFVVIPILLAISFFAALQLPQKFMYCLIIYAASTMLYSFRLKQIPVVDIIVLAMLYTLRILAGGMATQVVVSQWLLSFSLFIFLSLACVKRFSELRLLRNKAADKIHGRGYQVSDAEAIATFGASSGYISILVLVFYVNSKEVVSLYFRHDLLWFLCPLILYWITRLWLLAHRQQVHDDPLVFALTDKVSYLVGIVVIALLLLAV